MIYVNFAFQMQREWHFRVTITKTPEGEVVGVVGNSHQLGNWNHEEAFLLNKSVCEAQDG